MALLPPAAVAPYAGQGMRTYGRVIDTASGAKFWVQVNPDSGGWNDSIYLTTLIQCCKLNWNESPFYANWGIAARQSVVSQVFPDYYMTLMQQRFSPYFLSLIINKMPVDNSNYWATVVPTYQLNVQFHTGAQISTQVVPQALVDGFGQAVLDGHGYAVSVGVKSGKFVAV
jgi:hypothetical protein